MPEDRHRRLAVQLASQLPEAKSDAVQVLECLSKLVDSYLYGAKEPRLALVSPCAAPSDVG